MPTEFLHGLYDGGHGAGLNDYWKLMFESPLGAGGFLWALVDEGSSDVALALLDVAALPVVARRAGVSMRYRPLRAALLAVLLGAVLGGSDAAVELADVKLATGGQIGLLPGEALEEGNIALFADSEVDALLADTEQLTAVLTYHVVAGKVMAADVVKLDSATTVQGQSVSIRAGSDGVMVDGARVVKTDIATSNGVIHVIDRVILPEETS
mgnify:CR=1 FL=1